MSSKFVAPHQVLVARHWKLVLADGERVARDRIAVLGDAMGLAEHDAPVMRTRNSVREDRLRVAVHGFPVTRDELPVARDESSMERH